MTEYFGLPHGCSKGVSQGAAAASLGDGWAYYLADQCHYTSILVAQAASAKFTSSLILRNLTVIQPCAWGEGWFNAHCTLLTKVIISDLPSLTWQISKLASFLTWCPTRLWNGQWLFENQVRNHCLPLNVSWNAHLAFEPCPEGRESNCWHYCPGSNMLQNMHVSSALSTVSSSWNESALEPPPRVNSVPRYTRN